jgi:hypothetical protein
LIVTQDWNPPMSAGVFNPHQVGVAYDIGNDVWGIVNEDGTEIPAGAAFNVRPAFSVAEVGNVLVIGDHDREKLLWATHVVDAAGFDNAAPVVFFDSNTWTVRNADDTPLPTGGTFAIAKADMATAAFTVRTDAPGAVVRGNALYFSSSADGHPEALVFVTQNRTPFPSGPAPLAGVTSPFGVFYDAKNGQWAIFLEDFAPMPSPPDAAAFNVLAVFP